MSDTLPTVPELIPHRDPMIFLQHLTQLSSESVQARTYFPQGALGRDGIEPSNAWSLEIVSQACAAFIGHNCQEEGYRQGRLIKATNWILEQTTIPLHEELTVEATLTMSSSLGLFVFTGTLASNSQRLAHGQISILAQ
ncbi:MAG: hypothetical protein AAFX93_16970 [Verrucomicrobiota bacterium]